MDRRSFLGLVSALPIIGRLAASAPVAAATCETTISDIAPLAGMIRCDEPPGWFVGIALQTIPKGARGLVQVHLSDYTGGVVVPLYSTRRLNAGDFIYSNDVTSP